jgi:hypothetical protein
VAPAVIVGSRGSVTATTTEKLQLVSGSDFERRLRLRFCTDLSDSKTWRKRVMLCIQRCKNRVLNWSVTPEIDTEK